VPVSVRLTYGVGVKLAGVRTSTGAPVSLVFVESGVHVLSTAKRSRRLFRIAGGTAFAAVVVGTGALGVGHAVDAVLGTALAVAAPVLAIAAGVAAATAWMLDRRAERVLRGGSGQPDIAVEDVAWARSSHHDGRVHVVVAMADAELHEFSAAGVTGAHLARQFGGLLNINDAAAPATGYASDTTQQPE
jgi:hypothetical protein